MKKEFIFDLGRVLVTFDVDQMLNTITQDETCKSSLKQFYFGSLWNDYDRGDYSLEQMIDMGIQKFPFDIQSVITWVHSLPRFISCQLLIRRILNTWVKHLCLIPSTFRLLKFLHNQGHRIFILSNLPKQAFDYLYEQEEIKPWLEHGVYSYQERINKPDLRLYQILLDKYSIQVNNAIFIDDRKENVDAAKKLGLETIQCLDTNQLENKVRELL